ncbi:MAG: DNA-formamidopyrimidine glycosylase family protein [Candidatus Obscuribacterales bacterium]|nr:DNA-formamidopyrimidine glycosylase family protein [Candidatus Obscuribacterales bacterium]
MPELPDIKAYIHALEGKILGRRLLRTRIGSPFLLRTAVPPIEELTNKQVTRFKRIGKRIAIGFENDLWLVMHLMIAGRLQWRAPDAKAGGKSGLAAFDFADGTLIFTEAGSKHRASLHVVQGDKALEEMDPGGIEIFDSDQNKFKDALTAENRTLKRALTDPRILSGIGNAYSDEILHAAKLSPVLLTQKLKPEEWDRLYVSTRDVLKLWIDRLCTEADKEFPKKVTAFRPEMAVHGKLGQPCPVCNETIQRIRYADNETNYCAKCQTEGKPLADRSLSRVLKSDWPRTLDELEALKRKR